MKALVTSELARNKRTLKPQSLITPPSIPAERLDPNSPESRILGRFSKRREVNARWRFFLNELQKTRYPLQAVLAQPAASGDGEERKTDEASLTCAGIRSIGLQGSGVFEEAETLACPPALVPLENSTAAGGSTDKNQCPRPRFESHLPQRFLRRRYQQLLAQTPILTCHISPRSKQADAIQELNVSLSRPGRYTVSVSPNAPSRFGVIQSVADSVDMAWLQCAQTAEGAVKGKSKGKGMKSS